MALTVTAPFMLPYAVVAAAKLKRAKSVLIMHDLFPDVLVVAGILRPNSLIARAIRGANVSDVPGAELDRRHRAGYRDGCSCRYGEWIRDKIRFIPNWATLPPGVRPIAADNPYRRLCKARFIVGLSGNLGFTHDPLVVFDAARFLREDPTIHFLLSGWGIGFDQLKALQAEQRLPNVTLVERVADEDLEQLLSAADVWVIPYRKNVAGVSIPSRFYNLLAIGRPVVLMSEPGAEAAMTVTENDLGWVVPPGRPDELATALRDASLSRDPSMGERAAAIAGHFSLDRALAEICQPDSGASAGSKQPGGLP